MAAHQRPERGFQQFYIQAAVKDDPTCETIYLALYLDDQERADVIRDFGISEREFDNGHKRLKTIFRKVALKYNPVNE